MVSRSIGTKSAIRLPSHETKYCPRCNTAFECKAGTILQCQCNGITFTDKEKEFIAAQYNDCLCRKCLLELKLLADSHQQSDKF